MHEEVRAYFASLPPETRKILKRIRDDIRTAVPDAVEHFSYRIPGFRLDGKSLVWYAAFKSHVSMFPMRDAIRRKYARELHGLKTAKGTIQFPLAAPPSSSLVKKLVKARVAEVRESR
jgi:uncharacterized protein YdhG (YjbR/CyaY superfamily)